MRVPASVCPCWDASISAEPRKAPTQGVQLMEKTRPKTRAGKKPMLALFSCRLAISAGEWLCRLTGSEPIASLARGIANVYSLIITFLIIYAMMFIISTGFIMLFGSEAV